MAKIILLIIISFNLLFVSKFKDENDTINKVYLHEIKGDNLYLDDGYINHYEFLLSNTISVKDGDTVFIDKRLYLNDQARSDLMTCSKNIKPICIPKKIIRKFNRKNKYINVSSIKYYPMKVTYVIERVSTRTVGIFGERNGVVKRRLVEVVYCEVKIENCGSTASARHNE